MADRGLTKSGYIGNEISTDNIDEKFLPVVNKVIEELSNKFGELIHSIYLYGSVGRGDAVPYRSDLDIGLVTYQPVTFEVRKQLDSVATRLDAEFSIVSKLEFDIGHYQEVMVDNEYEWQCWLKHFCVCIWGCDLSKHIQPYRPSVNIGLEMNQDIQQRLDSAVELVEAGVLDDTGKSIAKKIIRTDYSLYSERDNSFYSGLEDMVETLIRYKPKEKPVIEEALRIATGIPRDKEALINLVRGYGQDVANRVLQMRTVSSASKCCSP
ncbi:nucleotidyltransferase domain-containing protein [Veronia pacifica]|uniref:Polymerase nucleotidyl transferase domain-containing protein n=2 Tax=Veronia pacifica TaxID=1080227 RepID=A0A1C3EIG9_9GAMM|nr:hypothetical protein A8L45_12190 [Veronia pacifica]